MSLKNDQLGRLEINEIIEKHYALQNRFARNFLHTENEIWNSLSSHYLIDRRHVVKFTIGMDRDIISVAVELGIGPHYFAPSNFWSYEKSKLFRRDASAESILHNLALLDTFFETLK